MSSNSEKTDKDFEVMTMYKKLLQYDAEKIKNRGKQTLKMRQTTNSWLKRILNKETWVVTVYKQNLLC